ncbi:DUF983 domain-containing protein [Elioraea rosea]|uniref:DUF983 domain-containing protein n=1 Tax=Elioraea rosea TaxID=2492390 RepID=UPI0011826B59|nr:DUF983 domain-containing protein [Elioraea rosea]
MTQWQPSTRSVEAPAWTPPPLWQALRRGAANRCPVCGEAPLFDGFLKVRRACSHCHAPLGRVRADDAPPYFTIFIVGHIVVPLMLWMERAYEPSLWAMAAIFLPLTLVLCLLIMRPVKGATVGLMLRLGVTGTENGPDLPDRPA